MDRNKRVSIVFYAEGLIHNPLGLADQSRIAGLYAFNPSNTFYGQLRYGLNLFSPHFRLKVGASNNEFVLGPGNSESVDTLQIEGETFLQDVAATYKLKRSRKEKILFVIIPGGNCLKN